MDRRAKILPPSGTAQPMISPSKHPRGTSCICATPGTAQLGLVQKLV